MFSHYQHIDSSFALSLKDFDTLDGNGIINALDRKASKLAPRFYDECSDAGCTNLRPGADEPRRQQVWDMYAEGLAWNLIADSNEAVALAKTYMRQGIKFQVGLETRQDGERAEWFQQAWVLKVGGAEFLTYRQAVEFEETEVVKGTVLYSLPGANEVPVTHTVEVPVTRTQIDWLHDLADSGSESYFAALDAGLMVVGSKLVIPPAAREHLGLAVGIRADIADEGEYSIGERRSILALARKLAAVGISKAAPLSPQAEAQVQEIIADLSRDPRYFDQDAAAAPVSPQAAPRVHPNRDGYLRTGQVITLACGHGRKVMFNDAHQADAKFWCDACDGMKDFASPDAPTPSSTPTPAEANADKLAHLADLEATYRRLAAPLVHDHGPAHDEGCHCFSAEEARAALEAGKLLFDTIVAVFAPGTRVSFQSHWVAPGEWSDEPVACTGTVVDAGGTMVMVEDDADRQYDRIAWRRLSLI
jgi:hypothetical protein